MEEVGKIKYPYRGIGFAIFFMILVPVVVFLLGFFNFGRKNDIDTLVVINLSLIFAGAAAIIFNLLCIFAGDLKDL